MSEIAERVTAHLMMCDFAKVDQGGKLNVVGGGIRILGLEPGAEGTAPFTLVLNMEAPVAGDSPALEILLTTAAGQVYKLPGANGGQAVRISQNIEFATLSAPGLAVPNGALPTTAQFLVNFSNGLPLKAGYSYQFRAQLDHEVVASYSFFVAAPPVGPVLG